MKLKIVIVTLLLLFQYSGFGQESEARFVDGKTADRLLEKAVEKREVTGIAAGLSIDGELRWVNGSGYRHAAQEEAFGAQTLTRIASLVKPMTAIAIMQLYEHGKIDLDVPIQQYLPDFPVKKEGDITIRHLLTHTSGTGSYASEKERNNTVHYETLSDAIAVFKDRKLLSAPGTAYHYTSYGYVVLGLVIERVSGMSYEAYMKQHIWDKAGMSHTGVETAGKEEKGKSLLYRKARNGNPVNLPPTDLSDRVPGGGVYSCVTDMIRFGNAVLNHTLIKESTLGLMLKDPGVKKGSDYGLGWTLYGNDEKHGSVFGHTGSQSGASAHLLLLPEPKITVVVLSNTSDAMKTVNHIAGALRDMATAAVPEE